MDELIVPGHDKDRRLFQQLVAHQGAPAFAARARRVQEAFDTLLAVCQRQRDEMLSTVRLRLGTLQALAGDWTALQSWLAPDQLELLRQMHATLQPRLRVPVEPTSSARVLRGALVDLVESLERFNRRWQDYLQGLDLTRVNDLREGYNQYYVLEKECMVRSARLARQGFRPLPPLTVADLVALLPPLPVPHEHGAC